MLLTLALPACSGEPADPEVERRPVSVQHDVTTGEAELLDTLPVLDQAVPEGKHVLLTQPLELVEGDVLLVTAEFQMTNDLGANVYVGSQLVLAEDASAVTGAGVGRAGGENITPDVHHGHQTRSATYQVTAADEGTRHVNLVVWAASSRAVSDWKLTVDRGYGQLSVVRW